MPVDPEIAHLLQIAEAGTPMHQQTPQAARESFRTLSMGMRKPERIPQIRKVTETTVVGADGELPARVFWPEGEGPFPTVALFHGGGFVIGDLDTHDNLGRRICRDASAVVVSVDYRLAPEHPFPAGVEDALAATSDLITRLDEFGDAGLSVAGDSAGGNLAAVVSQRIPGIEAQFLIYPTVDGSAHYASRDENATGYFLDLDTMMWFVGHYAPDEDFSDTRLSPLLHDDLEGLPPAVVVTAEFDPLRDEGEAYAQALRQAGVPVVVKRYDGMIHGFMDMDSFSEAALHASDDAIRRFARLLRPVDSD